MRSLMLPVLVLLLATASGCGKAPEQSQPPPAATASAVEVKPKAEPEATVVKPVQHVELQLATVANTMMYDKKSLTVPAGAEVHLVLKNNATAATLPHNWVVVKPGTEASVAAAGLKLGEQAGYFDVRDKDALVHTPMAKPGESSEVTFTAPDPGVYPYICTVPGHYMLMKGVLTVTP
ncbi:MAG: plastocyanin/azurin family copper-binding protein [Myxococcota bacterium]|nr:plastocyanin/azurin family copper-binding protein [Myxococcota bacterium]